MLIRGKDKCCVCRLSKKDVPFLHLFRFPKTKERCLQWIESAGVIDELRQYEPDRLHHLFRMCMRHFEPRHFKNSDMMSLNRHNAIPTLFGDKALPIDFFPKEPTRGKLVMPVANTCQNRTTINNIPAQFTPRTRNNNTENELATVKSKQVNNINYSGVCSISVSEYYLSETDTKTNNCDESGVIYSENIDDEVANDKKVTKNAGVTKNTVVANNILNTSNNDFIPSTPATSSDSANNRNILFRKICSTPLKLPSTMWTTVCDPNGEYFLVFLVSYFNGFLVNRGIRFTPDMSNPDIHIGGTKVLFSAFDPINCIEDVERLINDVDKLLLCPGTGLQGIGYSNTCTGLAQISESMNVIPCAECEILDNLVNMQNLYQK